jgi:integrase
MEVVVDPRASLSASNFLQREFYPALKAAELPRVVFHSLRHTASTILASSTIPPGAVHRILGHASFATTMKLYGGLTAQALESAAGTLAGAFEPRPDKRFVMIIIMRRKLLINWLPGTDSNRRPTD